MPVYFFATRNQSSTWASCPIAIATVFPLPGMMFLAFPCQGDNRVSDSVVMHGVLVLIYLCFYQRHGIYFGQRMYGIAYSSVNSVESLEPNWTRISGHTKRKMQLCDSVIGFLSGVNELALCWRDA